MHIDILCPNEWQDGICYSYASRVYLSQDCETYSEYRNWLSDTAQEYINNLDPEVHGNVFDVYVDYQYKGWIIRQKKEFNKTIEYLQENYRTNSVLQHSINNIRLLNGKVSTHKFRICVIDQKQFMNLKWEYDHHNRGHNNSLLGFKDTKEFYMRMWKEPKRIIICAFRVDTDQVMDRVVILPRNK
jgi:hypothetical protein